MIHLLFPGQQLTECSRVGLTGTTEVVSDVTCKPCLRHYLKRITLLKRLLSAKETATRTP